MSEENVKAALNNFFKLKREVAKERAALTIKLRSAWKLVEKAEEEKANLDLFPAEKEDQNAGMG